MKHENTKTERLQKKERIFGVLFQTHKVLFVRIPREVDNGVMNIGVLKIPLVYLGNIYL